MSVPVSAHSRGFKDAAASKGAELEAALLKASDNGKIPIVIDTSPCLAQVSERAGSFGRKVVSPD